MLVRNAALCACGNFAAVFNNRVFISSTRGDVIVEPTVTFIDFLLSVLFSC
jgi:hypothetical protein